MALESAGSNSKSGSRWSFFFVVSLAIGTFVVVSTVRETYRDYQDDQEKKSLEQKIQQLETRRTSLSLLLEQLQNPEVVDEEARNRLGLQKPGEHVAVLRYQPGDSTQAESVSEESSASTVERSYPRKWFFYFFHR